MDPFQPPMRRTPEYRADWNCATPGDPALLSCRNNGSKCIFMMISGRDGAGEVPLSFQYVGSERETECQRMATTSWQSNI